MLSPGKKVLLRPSLLRSKVADIIDNANATADIFLKSALSNKKPEAPQLYGTCLCCYSKISILQRWCDIDCRNDWERRQRAIEQAAIYDED